MSGETNMLAMRITELFSARPRVAIELQTQTKQLNCYLIFLLQHITQRNEQIAVPVAARQDLHACASSNSSGYILYNDVYIALLK